MPESSWVNIASHLSDRASYCGQTVAVICPTRHGPEGEVLAYQQFTFKALNQRSDRIAHGFERIGIKRGTRTVLMVTPGLDFFALTFALFKVGAVPVLVDPGIGVKNLGVCLSEAKPEAFIGIPKAHLARLLFGWAKQTLNVQVMVGHKFFWGGYSLNSLAKQSPSSPYRMAQTQGDETAAILFTSGSTGVPKGVVYSHANFAEQVRVLKEVYGIEPGEVDVATFPLFALFGPALGMTVIVPDMDASRPGSVDPRKIIGPIQSFSATNLFGSPALIERVGQYGKARDVRLNSLRRVLSAGAPANNDSLAIFASMLPPDVEIHTPYGATESLPVSSIGTDAILGKTAAETVRGKGTCIGKPVGRSEVFIIKISDTPISEWSDDLCLSQGEIGEIIVTGPVVTGAYFNRPQATALAKIEDPGHNRFFHRMGDLGYFDILGRLWFCGRKAHRVETRKGTLFTIPCERIFNQHEAIRRTALVGIPDQNDKGFKRPVLCVELLKTAKGKFSPMLQLQEQILALGIGNASAESIETILFHPSFPVDIRHNSKIFREQLATWAERQLK